MIIPHWLTLISLITLTGGCALIWQLRHMAQNTPAIQTLLQTSAHHQRLFLRIAFVPLALSVWALPTPQLLGFIDLRLVGLVLLMALAAALWLQRIGWAIGVMTLLLLPLIYEWAELRAERRRQPQPVPAIEGATP